MLFIERFFSMLAPTPASTLPTPPFTKQGLRCFYLLGLQAPFFFFGPIAVANSHGPLLSYHLAFF